MNYEFSTDNISQHVVKYGMHIQPMIVLKDEKTKLQDYCNWLIEQFPEVFETLLSGPNQLRVQKNFVVSGNKRVDMPTFILTGRGPLFTFPERLYIDQPQDVDIPQKDKIFRKALDELRTRFSDRAVRRVGVIHELVFDTGQIDSLEIIASNLKNDVWKDKISNLNIRLETPKEGKNINLEIRPTRVMRAGKGDASMPEQNMLFGIIVNVDINNRQIKPDLTKAEINDILTFAGDYVPEELIRFLNNEY
ncbi:MAG: hypothetical protein KAY65_04215 [Planctomycetes bacterium]|nr:hypothetical protein [Planctomycetota bacterium]